MSKGQCKPRNQPLKRALGRCKARETIEIIDVEDKDAEDKEDEDDVKIIEGEKSHHRMRRNSPPSEVINIDDDDEDAAAAYQYSNFNSPSSEESKSGTSPMTTRPSSEHRKNKCDIGPSRNRLGLGSSSSESCSLGSDSSSESINSDSSSSDCEIMGDVSGNIREQWERAALKKKMSHKAPVYSEDENFENEVFAEPFKEIHVQPSSNGSDIGCKNNFCSVPSTSYFSSPWNFDAKAANNDIDLTSDFFYDNPTMETGPNEMNPKYVPEDTYSDVFHEFTDPKVATKDPDLGTVHKDREPDIVCKDPDTETILNPYPEINVPNATTSCGNNVTGQKTADVEEIENIYMEEQDMSSHQFLRSTLFNGKTKFEVSTAPSSEEEMDNDHTAPESRMQVQDGLIINREKYKETDEYRQAAEEEWAARQRELQMQAEEAQRLKRKKKAETLRLVDMERRQRQRIEEVRELQKKDEETINLKEKIRAGVRRELEILEIRHRDMASVLRALGVPVKGGLLPTSQEVNAAYKQALLKFHPDRASRSDIHQQVKSEETFKLISRLKEKSLL